jgi:hypothetical protein
MPTYANYGALDTQIQTEGDFYFQGIDLKHDRPLAQGMVSKSINKRLRTGVATTRPGTRVLSNFNPIIDTVWLTSCVYSNPNGQEVLLAIPFGANAVYQMQDGHAPVVIPFPAPYINHYPVCMLQAFDKVLILQNGRTPMIWDGINPSGFVNMTKLDPADTSTNMIPNSVAFAIAFQNRVIYINFKDDVVYVSDINDPTSYDNVYGMIRINGGQGDTIMTMHPYTNESVLIFMNHSIHRLYNFAADLAMAAQDMVSDELGAVGREAVVKLGADVIFVSRAGFYRINQVFETQIVAAPVPISDLVAPLLQEIDWKQIFEVGEISLAVLDDYLYAAVLSKGGLSPQSIFVYNTVTGYFESVDAWVDPNVTFGELRVTLYQGTRRLFGINWANGDATPPQWSQIYLLYEGITDQTYLYTGTSGGQVLKTNPVNDILETRGYGNQGGAMNFKRFGRVSVSVRTRNPKLNISALTDGYNEMKLLTLSPITKDPTKFYTWGHKTFVAGDDPNEPKRMDYYTGSETLWSAPDMPNLIPGMIDLSPGIEPQMYGGPTTESIERRYIRRQGRWCSIRLENQQGKCDILGVAVDFKPSRGDDMTKA